MDTLIRGIVLGLSITAPVGPTNVEIIRRGTRAGWKSAAVFCVGVMVALVLYLLLVVFGLSFLTESALLNTVLMSFGVVVLAYLAYSSIKDFFTGTGVAWSDETDRSNRHFVPGVVLTLSNPAVLLMWTGIMGADLATSRASVGQGLLLSGGILIGVAIFFTGLTVSIHYGRRLLKPRYLRYVSLAAGVVLSFFCVKFGLELVRRLAR